MVRDVLDTVFHIYKPILLVVGLSIGLGIASGDNSHLRATRMAQITSQTFSCDSMIGGLLCGFVPGGWLR